MVALLAGLLQRSQAAVVLSSTWRVHERLRQKFQQALFLAGANPPMEGTPVRNWDTWGQARGADAVLERCGEIEARTSILVLCKRPQPTSRAPFPRDPARSRLPADAGLRRRRGSPRTKIASSRGLRWTTFPSAPSVPPSSTVRALAESHAPTFISANREPRTETRTRSLGSGLGWAPSLGSMPEQARTRSRPLVRTVLTLARSLARRVVTLAAAAGRHAQTDAEQGLTEGGVLAALEALSRPVVAG
jgi:hypothetical protein